MKSAVLDYTGNGVDNTNVTIETSFGTPDFVLIKRWNGLGGYAGPIIRTSTFSGDLSKPIIGAAAALADRIQAFGADTFQVSAHESVNKSGGNNLTALCCRDDGGGGFAVFTYTGNGGGARTITPGGSFNFAPSLVIVIPESTTDVYWKCDLNATNDSQTFSAAPVTTGITGISSGSIDVASGLNANTVVYHVVAFRSGAVSTFTYLGTGSGQSVNHGCPTSPLFVIVQSGDATSKKSTWKSYGTASLLSGVVDSNSSSFGIGAADSTTVTLGTGSAVNESGKTYIGLAFANDFAGGSAGVTHGQLLLTGVG